MPKSRYTRQDLDLVRAMIPDVKVAQVVVDIAGDSHQELEANIRTTRNTVADFRHIIYGVEYLPNGSGGGGWPSLSFTIRLAAPITHQMRTVTHDMAKDGRDALAIFVLEYSDVNSVEDERTTLLEFFEANCTFLN